MSRSLSTFLDLIRFLAALLVCVVHFILGFGCYSDLDNTTCRILATALPEHAGHLGVVVFFVLSGYVITYVAHEREHTLRDYAISRMARIYSVAIPAIVLTMIVDQWLIAVGKAGTDIPLYQYAAVHKYLPLFLTFSTDLWFLAESTFSNGGFWSLCYEVWYYMIFASAFYLTGAKKYVVVFVLLLIVGPKLWALFPLWLIGSGVYKLNTMIELKTQTARWLFAVSAIVAIVLIGTAATKSIDQAVSLATDGWTSRNLRFSQWFVGDTLVGLVIGINMFAAKYARLEFGWLARPIAFLASFTLTLYLMHKPVGTVPHTIYGAGVLVTALCLIAGVFVLGMATEHQKGRARDLLRWVAARIGATPAAVPQSGANPR